MFMQELKTRLLRKLARWLHDWASRIAQAAEAEGPRLDPENDVSERGDFRAQWMRRYRAGGPPEDWLRMVAEGTGKPVGTSLPDRPISRESRPAMPREPKQFHSHGIPKPAEERLKSNSGTAPASGQRKHHQKAKLHSGNHPSEDRSQRATVDFDGAPKDRSERKARLEDRTGPGAQQTKRPPAEPETPQAPARASGRQAGESSKQTNSMANQAHDMPSASTESEGTEQGREEQRLPVPSRQAKEMRAQGAQHHVDSQVVRQPAMKPGSRRPKELNLPQPDEVAADFSTSDSLPLSAPKKTKKKRSKIFQLMNSVRERFSSASPSTAPREPGAKSDDMQMEAHIVAEESSHPDLPAGSYFRRQKASAIAPDMAVDRFIDVPQRQNFERSAWAPASSAPYGEPGIESWPRLSGYEDLNTSDRALGKTNEQKFAAPLSMPAAPHVGSDLSDISVLWPELPTVSEEDPNDPRRMLQNHERQVRITREQQGAW